MIRTLFFLSLVGAMVLGNLAWWRYVHRRARGLKYARPVQIAAGAWAGAMFAAIAGIFLSRLKGWAFVNDLPRGVMAVVYVWHFLFVLSWVIGRAVVRTGGAVRAAFRTEPAAMPVGLPPTLPSRRDFLVSTAMMAPPALVTLAAWHGVNHLDEFRINRQHLLIPGLPPPLDGLTIAHVTDVHIGKFTDGRLLRQIVEQTNQLRPDLVLMTGDLIDFNLADLPAGLEMVNRLQPKVGLAMCEGNHDLFQGRAAFERLVRRSGVAMPINASTSLTFNGQEIQLLGLRWGGADLGDPELRSSDELIAESVRMLVPQVRPGAFPILLAHHPHAFDYLGNANVPLTLAGHTHGGQINLTPNLAPARLRFRYISGVYEQAGRKLVVSNGVGNWFPLRVNAPAEIVHLTLHAS